METNTVKNNETKEFVKKMSAANNGFLHLFINIAMVVGFLLIIATLINMDCMSITVADGTTEPTGWIALPIFLGIIFFIIWMLHLVGLKIIQPNMSIVLTLFGKYHGTVRDNGFFWINPFCGRRKLSLRARNMDVEPIKVNDRNGNPIMIGLVLVWRIADTYRACFDIDSHVSKTDNGAEQLLNSFDNFVSVQSDAALRKVAGMYAYDNMDNTNDELTLRSGGEEINDHLEEEIRQRLSIAGIEVVEARINYLAYAAEIASVMLRRQQANAIIAAREKIVEGAVSMVDLALKKLSNDNIVELDEEKKASMVSNLLVVLCADESASPVINTGTLYQ